jgi:hypothetical protein
MKFKELTTAATRAFHKAGFQLKKHSPEILVVTGVVGTVVSAVMACKATTKVSTIIDSTNTSIDAIHECANNPDLAEKYTKEDSKKDLAIVYVQTGVELAKLYGPSVILGTASITSILAGHNILRKRNLALAAAYQVVDTGFKQYRGRVVERFGEQLDKELKYDIKAKEIEEVIVDEKGEEKTVTKTVEVANQVAAQSPYTICFDETCSAWQRDAESNKFFLLRQQDYANERLKSRGYLFLNEVYDMIGARRTKAGQVVGWVYDENNPIGDNYVDFGIFDIRSEAARNFVNGLEKSIWLSFNVDGYILNNL